jgi:flagellar motor switch protein FliN/FliY
MGDMLSQEELNALLTTGDSDTDNGFDSTDLSLDDLDAALNGLSADMSGLPSSSASVESGSETLTPEQMDILGEIGNISMGTAATTLSTLLNSIRVLITTPRVSLESWKQVSQGYNRPCVGIRVNYTVGLTGSNVLILKENDVKIIADLMMGGEGIIADPTEGNVSDMELSAISEAMNQMIGSSATSLSSVLKRTIDIDTPNAEVLNFEDENFFEKAGIVETEIIACVSFRMLIGDLIDSEISQVIPIQFAKEMVDMMMEEITGTSAQEDVITMDDIDAVLGGTPAAAAAPPPMAAAPMPQPQAASYAAAPMPQAPMPQAAPQQMAMPQQMYDTRQPVMYPNPNAFNVQPATFQPLDMAELAQQKENIDIIMDVPLEVTVELGRTSRKIKEILEFAPGTVVDLDKLAGEPIDILVNGKFVATGEVVVVDENFAVRVIDIISVDKRI